MKVHFILFVVEVMLFQITSANSLKSGFIVKRSSDVLFRRNVTFPTGKFEAAYTHNVSHREETIPNHGKMFLEIKAIQPQGQRQKVNFTLQDKIGFPGDEYRSFSIKDTTQPTRIGISNKFSEGKHAGILDEHNTISEFHILTEAPTDSAIQIEAPDYSHFTHLNRTSKSSKHTSRYQTSLENPFPFGKGKAYEWYQGNSELFNHKFDLGFCYSYQIDVSLCKELREYDKRYNNDMNTDYNFDFMNTISQSDRTRFLLSSGTLVDIWQNHINSDKNSDFYVVESTYEELIDLYNTNPDPLFVLPKMSSRFSSGSNENNHEGSSVDALIPNNTSIYNTPGEQESEYGSVKEVSKPSNRMERSTELRPMKAEFRDLNQRRREGKNYQHLIPSYRSPQYESEKTGTNTLRNVYRQKELNKNDNVSNDSYDNLSEEYSSYKKGDKLLYDSNKLSNNFRISNINVHPNYNYSGMFVDKEETPIDNFSESTIKKMKQLKLTEKMSQEQAHSNDYNRKQRIIIRLKIPSTGETKKELSVSHFQFVKPGIVQLKLSDGRKLRMKIRKQKDGMVTGALSQENKHNDNRNMIDDLSYPYKGIIDNHSEMKKYNLEHSQDKDKFSSRLIFNEKYRNRNLLGKYLQENFGEMKQKVNNFHMNSDNNPLPARNIHHIFHKFDESNKKIEHIITGSLEKASKSAKTFLKSNFENIDTFKYYDNLLTVIAIVSFLCFIYSRGVAIANSLSPLVQNGFSFFGGRSLEPLVQDYRNLKFTNRQLEFWHTITPFLGLPGIVNYFEENKINRQNFTMKTNHTNEEKKPKIGEIFCPIYYKLLCHTPSTLFMKEISSAIVPVVRMVGEWKNEIPHDAFSTLSFLRPLWLNQEQNCRGLCSL